MARPPSTHPTDGELELLQVLWQAGPCGLGQICAALRLRRPIATTTVATILKVMLDKKLVRRKRTPQGYLWSAKTTRQSAATGMVRKLVDLGLRRIGPTARRAPAGIRSAQRPGAERTPPLDRHGTDRKRNAQGGLERE